MSHSEITIFKHRWIINIFIYYFTNILEKVIFNKWICDLVRFKHRCTVKASMKHLTLFIKKIPGNSSPNGDNFPLFAIWFWIMQYLKNRLFKLFLEKKWKARIFFLQLISCQSCSFVEMSHRLEITSIFCCWFIFQKMEHLETTEKMKWQESTHFYSTRKSAAQNTICTKRVDLVWFLAR